MASIHRIPRLALCAALAAPLLWPALGVAAPQADTSAAAAKATSPPTTVRIFTLKHVDPRALANVLRVFGGEFRPDPEHRVLAWTGRADAAAALEEAVARLDVPPPAVRNVEITVHLLGLSRGPGPSGEIPEALRGAADQLRKVLGFPSARLLDSVVLRMRDGGDDGRVSGVLNAKGLDSADYELRVAHLEVISDADGARIRLAGLSFKMLVPRTAATDRGGTRDLASVSIGTDVELRPGTTAVIGKASLAAPDDAIALVLTAALVD